MPLWRTACLRLRLDSRRPHAAGQPTFPWLSVGAMPYSTLRSRVLRFSTFAALFVSAAWLAACGGGSSGSGTSAFLTPGPQTTAPPGNVVLYAAMSRGNRIDAYRLGTDGLLPGKPFDSISVRNPRRLAIANGVLYASLDKQLIAMRLGADGSLPDSPTSETILNQNSDPIQIAVQNNVVYSADAGLNRVQSFRLDEDGDLPPSFTGSGEARIPGDYVSLAFNGTSLYAGARSSEVIDLFLLKPNGDVPIDAENQSPQDGIALPDDLVFHNNIIYVTSAGDKSIRAYKLVAGGFLPTDQSSRTETEEYYEDILIENGLLYAAAYNAGRIDLYHIESDGMLNHNTPFSRTEEDPETYPSKMEIKDGILYVSQAGINRIDAYVLDESGVPPNFPTSSTKRGPDPSFPLDIALYDLN